MTDLFFLVIIRGWGYVHVHEQLFIACLFKKKEGRGYYHEPLLSACFVVKRGYNIYRNFFHDLFYCKKKGGVFTGTFL